MLTLRKLGMVIIFAGLALTILNYQTASANVTVYVSPEGSDYANCGVYPSVPCRTIQYALTKIGTSYGIVILMNGTFSSASGEVFPITMQGYPEVHISSQHGRTNTFIDASGSGQNAINVPIGYQNTFEISGVTIKGAYMGIELSRAQGVYGYNKVDIHDNDISNNVAGIYAAYTTGHIRDNNFSGNTKYGIYADQANVTISGNSFGFNCTGGTTSYDAAIYLNHSSARIENNLIGWNNGSGIYNSNSSPIIINNTILLNYGGSGIAVFNASGPDIINNIITSNGYIGIHADSLGSWHNSYNDVWANGYADYLGTSPGTGSISKDPRLVSWFDAHLQCSSPAINAGTNTDAPLVDYDYNPRPVGGIVDMGAYEKQTDLFCPIYLPLIFK